MNNQIVFQNIDKKYAGDKNFALNDISLEIREGEFFCLLGPSGCGKTTVLKLITGLEEPNRGKIERPQDISMVFQSGALLPWLTVEENAAFGLKIEGEKEEKAKQTALEYLEMVKLQSFRDKYPRELSGGQKQRVGIARALATKPKVLLLDEPFSALDSITTEEMHTDLLNIWKETKLTIVMVSHQIEEAVLLADRLGVMSLGTLKALTEIKVPRPRTIYSEGFQEMVKTIKSQLLD